MALISKKVGTHSNCAHRVSITSCFRVSCTLSIFLCGYFASFSYLGKISEIRLSFQTVTTSGKKSELQTVTTAEFPTWRGTCQDDMDSLYGVCKAAGPRKPLWGCSSDIREQFIEFLDLYQRKPLHINYGGMRIEDMFGMWYILNSIRPRPTTIIESGVRYGQGTWLITQMFPDARIFALDPFAKVTKFRDVNYFTGNDFQDFRDVPWEKFELDMSTAVIVLDDDQSSFRRVIREGRGKGFSKFIVINNIDYLSGKQYSIKWACEIELESLWPGVVHDSSTSPPRNMSWQEHIADSELLNRSLKTYYEFPPILASRHGNDVNTKKPLFPSWKDLKDTNFNYSKELYYYSKPTFIELHLNQ